MSTAMKIRVSDNASFLLDKNNGFHTRKRTPIQQIVFLFGFIAFVVIGTTAIVYYNSVTGVYICFSFGIVFWFVGHQLEKIKLLLNVTEFMNALFSSALAKKYKFTAVLKVNGDIIYFNRNFQEFFPEFMAQSNRSLETLMTTAGASTEHIGAALKAVSQNAETRTSVIMQTGEGKAATPFALSFEPIERPTGFILLRGE